VVTLGAQGAQDTASTHDMIISIQGKVAKEIWTSNQSKTLPRDFWIRAKALLTITHATSTLDDLRIQDEPSSIRLHKLRGDRRHYWSGTIKLPWCITFKLKNGEFSEVMIENYHRG
jgi:proteic killer suppression protein